MYGHVFVSDLFSKMLVLLIKKRILMLPKSKNDIKLDNNPILI